MLVSFEGIDGSGKSTQAAGLVSWLTESGADVVATREPGGTDLGERIRGLLLDSESMGAWTEAALFAAARAQLVEEVIRPALAAGRHVVCDRFIDSSLAYQGIARGLGVDEVLALNEPGLAGLMPDRTFVLDLSVRDALARRERGSEDRIESEGEEFLAAVGDAYRALAARYPRRIVLIEATGDANDVAARVRGSLPDAVGAR